MDMEGVDVTAADQCMFGLKTWGMDGKSWEAAMKKTRFMSNSPEILSELTRKCDERHRHHVMKMLELTEHTTTGEIPEEETADFDVEAWDDVTGKVLDPKAVRQARLKEMKYVKEKEVWQPISREEARR